MILKEKKVKNIDTSVRFVVKCDYIPCNKTTEIEIAKEFKNIDIAKEYIKALECFKGVDANICFSIPTLIFGSIPNDEIEEILEDIGEISEYDDFAECKVKRHLTDDELIKATKIITDLKDKYNPKCEDYLFFEECSIISNIRLFRLDDVETEYDFTFEEEEKELIKLSKHNKSFCSLDLTSLLYK